MQFFNQMAAVLIFVFTRMGAEFHIWIPLLIKPDSDRIPTFEHFVSQKMVCYILEATSNITQRYHAITQLLSGDVTTQRSPPPGPATFPEIGEPTDPQL